MNVKIELSSDMLAAIDQCRAKTPGLPPRTVMIRTLITKGMVKLAEDEMTQNRKAGLK